MLKLTKHISFFTIILFFYGYFVANASAQQLDREQIKSAYLYNFIKHVQWPNEHDKKEITLAVYQDARFYQSISKMLGTRLIKNIPITVLLINDINQGREADVVFVNVIEDINVEQLATKLRQTATLLVTNNSLDKRNIMINLVFNEDTQAITFEVNKSNIIYEELTLSSELLLLGGSEVDVAMLYRETEIAMQKMKQSEDNLRKALAQQNKKIDDSTERLNNLNAALKNREKIAEQRQVELVALKKDIDRQKKSLLVKEAQLKDVVIQLSSARKNLLAGQQAVIDKENENVNMAERIQLNKDILDKQQRQIDQQGTQLEEKNKALAQGKERISQQRFYITLLVGLIFLAIIFSILVAWLFIKNKRTTRKLADSVSHLKDMQEQLVQSEKLASLGKLTAGIAHEINTPLGIAVTATSSFLESTKNIKKSFEENAITRKQMEHYFDGVEQAAELNMSSLDRVIELLNNFKQVAADQVVGEVREINCKTYINEIMQTLSAELKRFRVKYEYRSEEDIFITTMPGAIAQILTNLVTNTLRHGFEGRASGNIFIQTVESGNNVIITYEDDGCGMNQEVLRNIFEPFFTTKRNHGGTGLGMNIVFNIINQKLKGTINIESSEGNGARFIITLPKTV